MVREENRTKKNNVRIHGAQKENVIFVVHRHDNEQFRVTAHEIRPQRVAHCFELVRIAGRCGIPHLGHFLDVVFARRDDVRRDGYVKDEVAAK